MKNPFLILLISCLLLEGLIFSLEAQFVATARKQSGGVSLSWTVYHSGEDYRYDLRGKENMHLIVKPKEEKAWLIWPDLKEKCELSCSDPDLHFYDPIQAYETARLSLHERNVGESSYNGMPCLRKDVFLRKKIAYSCWIGEEILFPVYLEGKLSEGFSFELFNIVRRKPDSTFFLIPEEYQKVDLLHYPVTTTPSEWVFVDAALPICQAFKEGTQVIIRFSQNKRFACTITNEGKEPVKVIREFFKDGFSLPLEEQGTEISRTTWLKEGDIRQQYFTSKFGDFMLFKVYHGTIHVEFRSL